MRMIKKYHKILNQPACKADVYITFTKYALNDENDCAPLESACIIVRNNKRVTMFLENHFLYFCIAAVLRALQQQQQQQQNPPNECSIRRDLCSIILTYPNVECIERSNKRPDFHAGKTLKMYLYKYFVVFQPH